MMMMIRVAMMIGAEDGLQIPGQVGTLGHPNHRVMRRKDGMKAVGNEVLRLGLTVLAPSDLVQLSGGCPRCGALPAMLSES